MPSLRSSVRKRLKRSAEMLLCGSGAARAARWRHRHGTLVLAYHDIVPHGEAAGGDRSLHLPQREFARQLDLIEQTYEVVPLEALAAPPATAGRPRAVITFDDAYEGALTAGVAELARRGMPATVFVAPAFVGGGAFWWDAFAGADDDLPPGFRDRMLGELGGRDAEIRRWAMEAGMEPREVAPHEHVASEARLAEATRAGITLGAHTWSHPDVTALEGEALEREMAMPLRWLRERFDAVVPWLAYPYGLSSPAAEEAARRAGYAGAFRVDGGWLMQDLDRAGRYALPRINIPSGASLEYFSLLTSGLLGR